VRTFFTSITADGYGNAAMCFARSSPSEFISMSTAFRYKSDPLGTFQPSVIQKESTSPNAGSRWGDYSEVEVDPVNGITFWAHHEYREASWRTWVQAVTPPFHPADLNFDGMVGTADLLILLGEWGPCADCDDCPADLDGNCVVSTSDLLILLSAWG
jgi:hypothetical protein